MKPKILPLLLAFLLLLEGCAPSLKEHAETREVTTTPTESIASFPTLPPEPLPTVPAEPLPPETEPPVETEPMPVTITSAIGLRDFLRSQEEAGCSDFSFYYTPTTVNVSSENLARVGGYFYVQTQVEGDYCTVHVVEYPGERMVDAWRSGDHSALTESEVQALQTALSLVAQAREESSSQFDLERRLFDLFRSHVSYNDGSTEIPDPSAPPRHLTAVGALVDGSANCQGYADGFYVLASLAGFRVERMHVDIPEGGHTVNVIYLDGAWYVVDCTYNDLDDPSGVQISYARLNVGKDKCLRYSWWEEVERYPIAQLTDHQFYYYRTESRHYRCFDTIDAMAQRMVDDWRTFGTAEYYLLLEGQLATWQELGSALDRIAADYGLQIPYEIWYEHNVEDTYFYISLG